MEEFLKTGNGIAALCALVTLKILTDVAQFLWKWKENKDRLSDESIKDLTKAVAVNTSTTEKNTQQIEHLEHALAELPKLKLDLRRAFTAIRKTAGERWPEVRKEMMDEIDQ